MASPNATDKLFAFAAKSLFILAGGMFFLTLPASVAAQGWSDEGWYDDLNRNNARRDAYWEEKWGPEAYDEGLEQEIAEQYVTQHRQEVLKDLDAPSMVYDSTDEGSEFVGEDYGYPAGPAHPHAPLFQDQYPGFGGFPERYYSVDWYEPKPEFDTWYDDEQRTR